MRKTSIVSYRSLRPNNITSKQYRHLLLLLYWPLYLLVFFFAERVYPVKEYFPVECSLDRLIPFCEYFIIPYVLWYLLLAFIQLYALAHNTDLFGRLMKYIIITFSAATLICYIFPTCQNLRPEQFANKNIFTDIVEFLYVIDTNTNVLPSVHVIGSFAAMSAALHSNMKKWVKTATVILVILICLSTVFLKQHSVLDGLAAIPICLAAEFICYRKKKT